MPEAASDPTEKRRSLVVVSGYFFPVWEKRLELNGYNVSTRRGP